MQKIAPDKWRHFWAGIVLGIVLQAFMAFLLNDHFVISLLFSFALVVAVSYGFELFSKITGKGHYDVMDAVASVIGGIVGISMAIGIQAFW